jgi:hypothetical protein
MSKDKQQKVEDQDILLPDYDFSQGVRGKHFREYQQGYSVTITYPDGTQTVKEVTPDSGVIVLDPDIRRYFPDSESVNRTLRMLLDILPPEVRDASATS